MLAADPTQAQDPFFLRESAGFLAPALHAVGRDKDSVALLDLPQSGQTKGIYCLSPYPQITKSIHFVQKSSFSHQNEILNQIKSFIEIGIQEKVWTENDQNKNRSCKK